MKLVKIILLLVILSISMCISSEVSKHKGDEKKGKKNKRNHLDQRNNLQTSSSNSLGSQSQSKVNNYGQGLNQNLNSQVNQPNLNSQVNQPNLNSQVNQPNQNKNNLGNLENLNQNDRMNSRNLGNSNNQVDRNNFNHQHNPNGKDDYNNQQLNKVGNQQNHLNKNNLNHNNQKDPFKVSHQGGYSPKVQPIWFNHFRWSWIYGIPSYSRRYILSHRSLCLDVCERREVMCNGSDVVTEYDLTTGFLKCVCTNDRSKALVDNEYCWTPRKCVLAVENVGCTPILNAIFQKKKDLGYDDEI